MQADESTRPVTVHLIGNAHIDPIWLWPVSEGREEVLGSYRTAIMLIREFDGYVFTSGGSVTFRWVEEDDPALFAEIVQAVKDGHWSLVNGWWLQPDCNIPSGESFARHALYGQRYLQSRFGKRATVGYNVDSFGHAGTLPQLLHLGGLDSYVFFRPGPHEMELPNGPFWWEAPGGASVLACRPPLHYGSPGDGDVVERATKAAASVPNGLRDVLCFYGVGNHGGGPTRRDIQDIVRAQAEGDDLALQFAAAEDYFGLMRQEERQFPVVASELQHHARGCYSVLLRSKQENRRAEHAAMQAERLASLATLLAGLPSAQAEIDAVWEGTLFNQFHDILAGTSIRRAYEDVWATYEQGRQTLHQIATDAMNALGAKLEVRSAEHAYAAWNTLPWPRREVVRLSIPVGGWRQDRQGRGIPRDPKVTDGEGNALPCQMAGVTFDDNVYIAEVDVLAEIPPMGAKVLYPSLNTDPADPDELAQDLLAPTADGIANEHLRVRLDPESGALASITDLASGREMLGGLSALPLVIEDRSDTWSHDIPAFTEVAGSFAAEEPLRLVERGPIRSTLRSQMVWGSSRIIMDVSLTTGARCLDIDLNIDWHEQHKMLKLAFVAAGADHSVTSSAPYGHVCRATTCEEEPTQAWVDLEGKDTDGTPTGLCLINDGLYGYDACENELRLSLLRSPIYAFHDPREVMPGVRYHYIDQGEHHLRLQLIPHVGGWRSVLPDREASAWHEPLVAVQAEAQDGEATSFSLLEAASASAVTAVVKLGEDGGLVVRGYECAGQPSEVMLTSEALGQRWRFAVEPHEIWTVALAPDGSVTRLNLLEEPLA